uniref:Membrane cofactor protein n=1 Tax=Plecoglossus altivelis TaxID=61084 RepID=A0A7S5SAF6_PLEAT|nr:membrane cofactor protein [Plecoglossus altivelis]
MQSLDTSRCWLLASCLCLASMVGTVQAQDCTRPVGGNNTVLSPEDIGKTEFVDGSSVTFKCDIGYEQTGGSRTMTCTKGEWSTPTMTCERKNCGSPGEVLNGQFDLSGGTKFGDTVVATCNLGFKLIGSNRRQCMDGGWSGRVPICEVSKCGRAPNIVNGRPSSNAESHDYGAPVSYSCNSGFTLSGSKTIVCKGDEVFEPAPPKCIKVECPYPDVSNAIVIEGGSAPYEYLSFLTFECKSGFVMTGLPSITCEIESQWKPSPPECKAPGPKPTDKPKAPSNTGAIVGGVIGALALVAVAIGCFLAFKKKGAKRSSPPVDSL